MTTRQAVLLAEKMLKEHKELRNWKVTLNRRKGAFGVCNYRYNQIELSSLLIPETTDDSILNTIIHEIAHALTPGHHHNSVWRAKFIELGGDGRRCGGQDDFKNGSNGKKEFEKKTSKYTLTCPVCGKKTYMNRRPSRIYACGQHGRGFNIKYKLTITQNY
jgi:ribosomal protein L37AE/L43A